MKTNFKNAIKYLKNEKVNPGAYYHFLSHTRGVSIDFEWFSKCTESSLKSWWIPKTFSAVPKIILSSLTQLTITEYQQTSVYKF
jgi:hypothetical protein